VLDGHGALRRPGTSSSLHGRSTDVRLQLVDEASGSSASERSPNWRLPWMCPKTTIGVATSGHSRAGGVFVYQIPAVLYAGAAVRGSKDEVRFAVSAGSKEVPSNEVPSPPRHDNTSDHPDTFVVLGGLLPKY
jgi:hypothetical protein